MTTQNSIQGINPPYLLIASIALLLACDRNDPASSKSVALLSSSIAGVSAAPSDTAQWSVPINTSTMISVQTLPFSGCFLHAAIAEETGASAEIYADDVGVVRFYLEPSASDLNRVVDFVLDCTSGDGSLKSFPVQIRVVSASMPATSNPVINSSVVQGAIRVPLAGDPTVPSAQELAAGNYPPRPDQKSTPAAYQNWLKLVSTQATIVSSRVTAKDDESFSTNPGSPINSHTWGGSALDQYVNPYQLIEGYLTVPGLIPTGCSASQCEAAFWMGMDGLSISGTADVLQAGVDVKQTKVLALWVSSYNTFIEWAPNGSFFVNGMVPQAGDSIYFNISVGDSNHNNLSPPIAANTPGVYGWFYIYNYRTQALYTGSLPMPSGITFKGASAEWITERPLSGGVHWPLAHYAVAEFFNVDAWSAGTVIRNFLTDDTYDENLTDSSGSGQILAQAAHAMSAPYNAVTAWHASGTTF